MENTSRRVLLVKVAEAYAIFRRLIIYNGISQILSFIEANNIASFNELISKLPADSERLAWSNVGGQLIPTQALNSLLRRIQQGKANGWEEVHAFYARQGQAYEKQKTFHAYASLLETLKIKSSKFNKKLFADLLRDAMKTREWITKNIYESRAKDYTSPFRQMVYETEKEMEKVIGKLKDNSFIKEQQQETLVFQKRVNKLLSQLL